MAYAKCEYYERCGATLRIVVFFPYLEAVLAVLFEFDADRFVARFERFR